MVFLIKANANNNFLFTCKDNNIVDAHQADMVYSSQNVVSVFHVLPVQHASVTAGRVTDLLAVL